MTSELLERSGLAARLRAGSDSTLDAGMDDRSGGSLWMIARD
jgi:hypothetical protein